MSTEPTQPEPLVADDRLQPDGSLLSIGRIPDYVLVKCAKCGQRTAEVDPKMTAAAAEKAICALCFKALANQAGTPVPEDEKPIRMTYPVRIDGETVAKHGPALPLLVAEALAKVAEEAPEAMLSDPQGCAALWEQAKRHGLLVMVVVQGAVPPKAPPPPKEEPSRIIVARRKRIGSRSAFTLIELGCVVMIVAIILAIAVPNLLEEAKKRRQAEAGPPIPLNDERPAEGDRFTVTRVSTFTAASQDRAGRRTIYLVHDRLTEVDYLAIEGCGTAQLVTVHHGKTTSTEEQ